MDLLYNLAAIFMVSYWLLWMVGVKAPGIGNEPFLGWHGRRWTPPTSLLQESHFAKWPRTAKPQRVNRP